MWAGIAARTLLLSTTLLFSVSSSAETDFFATVEVEAPAPEENPYTLFGSTTLRGSYGFEAPDEPASRTKAGFNSVELAAFLGLDYTVSKDTTFKLSFVSSYDAVYELNDSLDPSQDELDAYETEVELKDAYVDSALTRDLYIRIGHQIVALGEADNLVITDVIGGRNLPAGKFACRGCPYL